MAENDYPLPHAVQFRGSVLARWLLARLGWQVHFQGFPALQGVAIVYPHTSNWDFLYMILAKWALGIPARFWAKDSLFRVPVFGPWLRFLGGVPVDRRSSRGMVGSMVDNFLSYKKEGQYFWLGLSPEGTRKYTPGWRSGFYQVTHQAQVPLALIRLDYGRKEVRVDSFIRLTGDVTADYARMVRQFEGVVGCRPEQAAPIRPVPISNASRESS
ncbi:MAG: 1-acyl-sn-glycerol-3-phosphate acyltransferase [Pseudomonadota bacterium]|jgi:1-acyl-sn-glycerol-3-phosphate acyltransferase